MIHNTSRSGKYNEAKLSAGQQVVYPLFNSVSLYIESRRDDSALVQTSNQLDNNLSTAVIINDFKFSNVTMLLHYAKEFNDHFARGSDEHLALSTLFSIDHGFKAVV